MKINFNLNKISSFFLFNCRKENSGTLVRELKSDVILVVEGKRIFAVKSFLSEKSSVFSAMFSGNFKESQEIEIPIEDTTYEAFNTFIQYLHCDHLVLKDKNDFHVTQELYKLSKKYDVPRLERSMTYKLYKN